MQRNHSFHRQGTLLFNTLVVMLSVVALVMAGSVSEAAPPQQSPIPQSPLRVMVPSDQVMAGLRAQGYSSMLDVFPAMTPASYQPGPRMPILNQLDGGPDAVNGLNRVRPMTTFRTLAILVDFSDNPATAPAAYFDTLVFGTTGSQTVNRYYNEASYGLLDIVTLNLPSAMGWQRAPQTYDYYVGGGYCTDAPYPNNCRKLAEDVTALVDPVVNFANYDNDGDGYVDTVFIIHAGEGAEITGDPDDVWSHSWWTSTEPVRDGKKSVLIPPSRNIG